MQTHRARLDSWKEISAELGVSERTARRYETLEGLPVHRHMHEQRGSVYAWSDELESWKLSRSSAIAGGSNRRTLHQHHSGIKRTSDLDETQHLPLIGRDQERDQLLRAVDAARAGRGSVILIEGEPGIGKTHLVRAILPEAIRRGCFGVAGHCHDMEGAPPYEPFVEVLEYCARFTPGNVFRKSMGDSAAELIRLAPGLRQEFADIPAPVELPPEQQRRLVFSACRAFVERSARLQPIVAVFEDIHWADDATLMLLSHLTRTVSTVPLLLVATYRSADAEGFPTLAHFLENCVRDKAVSRLRLRSLALPAVGALLDQLSGQTAPAQLVSFVFDQTEGNPFFIEELFLDLRAEGKLFDEQGAWREDFQNEHAPVPQGVRLVIGRRLDRLQEHTQRVLRVAAIIGRSFGVHLLEALETEGPEAILDALDEAQSAQLIEADATGREPKYNFVHELIRKTLAQSLSLPRRQRLHAVIADALERLFAADLESQASTLAHHCYQAGTAADAGKTIGYLVTAARVATSSTAHEEALAYIERALALAQYEQKANLADLVAHRAALLRSLSRMTEAIEAYEQAIELFSAAGRFAEAAVASHSLGHIHLWRADPVRACAVVHRTIQVIGTGATLPRYRLQLLNAVSLGVKGDTEAAFAALTAARQMESALPDTSLDDIGYGHMCEAHICYFAARLKEAVNSARSAVAAFRKTGNRWAEVETYQVMSDAMWLGGATAETDKLLAELLLQAVQVGHLGAAWTYRFMAAERLMHKGELARAEQAAREMHDLAIAVPVHWSFLDNVLLAAIAHYRGDLREAVRWTRRGLEMEPECYLSGQLNGCLFWTLAAQGDAAAEDALSAARTHLPVEGRTLTIGSSSCLLFVIEGLALADRREEAAALESRAEWAMAQGPYCLYTRHLFRTSAGIAAACAKNWARAEEHHQTAIHIADSTECRVAQPVARYWYADMLRARDLSGDRERARELLSAALSQYQTIGMVWHAGLAAKQLLS